MPRETFLYHANMNHRPAGDHLGRSVQEVSLWSTEQRLQANPFLGREQQGAKVAEITPLVAAIAEICNHPGDLTIRLNNSEARVKCAASIGVRKRLAEPWNAI